MTRKSWLVPLAASLIFSACSMTPELVRPETESNVPDAFEHTGDGDADQRAELKDQSQPDSLVYHMRKNWWTVYDDPVLNRLVDSVLVRNLDVRLAAARVLEVHERYRIVNSKRYPQVQVRLAADRQNTPSNSGATGPFSSNIPDFPDRFDFSTYSASLGFSYEIDFWGKAKSASEAAIGEYVATAADFRTAEIGITSETIATYFEIRDLLRQRELLSESAELLGERWEISEVRYRRGLISSFELYVFRQTFDDARAALPLIDSQLVEARGRLAILLGIYSDNLGNLLPETLQPSFSPAPVPVGVPSQLLQARPDLLASAARLEAARQNIGLARAERFPSISLTGAGGMQSGELSKMLDPGQGFWQIGGSLLAPVFNAGALKANEKAAWARYMQAEAAYEKSILTAFKEVDAALSGHTAHHLRWDAVREANESAEASEQTQLRRFRRGVGEYVAVLDARINRLRSMIILSASERSVALARLSLHRALGGEWTDDNLPDQITTLQSKYD